jgi:hypothetical protein
MDWVNTHAGVISLGSLAVALLALWLNWRNTRVNVKKYKEETQGKLKADLSVWRDGSKITIKNNGSEAQILKVNINDQDAKTNVFVNGSIPDTIAKGSQCTLSLNINGGFKEPFNVEIVYSDRHCREEKKMKGGSPKYITTV